MTITIDTVAHYAKLANLTFDEQEARLLADQLGTILGHVEKISELDLKDVQPTSQLLQQGLHMREDEPRDSLGSETALMNAPDAESDHFLVPKVIKR